MTELVQILFGSRLYGTATPASDTDLKSVHIPAARQILLMRVQDVVSEKTKSDLTARNTSADVDRESFALHKYIALACAGQTVALDMLFAPAWSWTREPDPLWLTIVEHRARFISKRCQAFVGYCRQQANKYGIKGSRMAAARAAVELLEWAQERYGTVAKLSDIADQLQRLSEVQEHAAVVEIPVGGDRVVRHLDVCGRKSPFTSTIKNAHEIYRKLFDEYGQRALAAEQNAGIDWKALSHAVRVGRQAIELLGSGQMTFPRPEAEHLVAIKTGRLDYATVSKEIEQLLVDVEAAAAVSRLPAAPDADFCERLILRAHHSAVATLAAA